MSKYQSSLPLFDPPIVPPPRVVEPNSTVEPQDIPRLTRALTRLLRAMGTRWWTATELTEIAGRRYGARLNELSKCGFPHEAERVSGGEFRYRLISSPTNGLMEEQ